MSPVVHVVLIKYQPQATEAQKQDVYDRYQVLADEVGGAPAGIAYFAVRKNLDTRKGVELIELGVFKDDQSFQAFLDHPKHMEIQHILRSCADWWVGDYNDLPNIITH
jgi:hypothetical protein